MEEGPVKRKAALIRGGPIQVPADFKPPFRISRSTAGPGAGRRSLVFAFNGMRVKKVIVYEDAEFSLLPKEEGYSILRDGEVFIEDVSIEPVVFHAPEQAFFNMDQRCMFHCLFCNSPLLGVEATKGLTKERMVEMTKDAMTNMDVRSVALTSGVVGSVQETVNRMVECVSHFRREIPSLPVGVEPYVETREQIQLLHDAGAEEIKINLETPDETIFRKVCPELDHSSVWEMLQHAVDVFGSGKVASNIIFGMGESDSQLIDVMERMAAMGVVPGLRLLVVNDSNRSFLEGALGPLETPSEERILALAREQRSILERHGLDTRAFRSMCFACTCCDIVPFRDI